MKAILWTDYGKPDVLKLAEIDKPVPARDEILIHIEAANIFTGDTELRQFKVHPSLWLPIRLYMGVFKPRMAILGQEFSGTVEAMGTGVSEFEIGDEVFGSTHMRGGAYAEYICLPASYPIIKKPAELDHIAAATIPVGGQHALHFLRLAKLQAGQHILIFGACGCIGTYAVQLAKRMGAEVSVVDSSEKLPLLLSVGADHAIDYQQQDFTQSPMEYDVIFDVMGASPYSASLQRVKPGGCYILANAGLTVMLRAMWTNRSSNKTVIFELARVNKTDLEEFVSLMLDGSIKALIDRTYPLAEAAAAHAYIDAGNKQGHVVLVNQTTQ